MKDQVLSVLRENLQNISKPARYTDNEINSYQKKFDPENANFCLIYPDLYEIGISNLGLKILYSILNAQPDSMADRQYSVHPDFYDIMKSSDIPLYGIESGIPLDKFDIIGFTLQTELTFTNVLKILELAKITLLSKDRKESDPIIIMGGPCATNPLPMADFGDLFFIGEAEEAILEIKEELLKTKKLSRQERIKAISNVEGVYAPDLHKNKQIKIRKFHDFHKLTSITKDQLIPWLQPTHDRFVCEIMRGCTRGCRFCFAGYHYRPNREHNPQDIVDVLIEQVKKYGWEEASLVSLSSSDYSCIGELLSFLMKRLEKERTSLSLPSLRVDSIDKHILEIIRNMQQNGLTIAPEAGSQRLRDIINKNLTEEDILDGITLAYKNGWRLIKLYFMIGLPFEIEDDINAIVSLIEKIIASTNKQVRINITLSPFVPKILTPFQWSKMEDKDILLQKIFHIKNSLKKYKFLKIKYHTIENSLLECVIGRGNRDTGKVIYHAYQQGAHFDSWVEFFDYKKWELAFDECKLDPNQFTKEFDLKSPLSWDFIDYGVDKKFFSNEYKKASDFHNNLSSQCITKDCKEYRCIGCGVCRDCKPIISNKNILKVENNSESVHLSSYSKTYKYRIFYEKGKDLIFLGHLDLLRMLYRVIKATNLPIVYTDGYNKHPKIVFSQPLPLGVASECEYFDLFLSRIYSEAEVLKSFPEWIFRHIKFFKVIKLSSNKKHTQIPNAEDIHISSSNCFGDLVKERIQEFNQASSFIISKTKKGKEKQIDLKKIIYGLKLDKNNNTIYLSKRLEGANIIDILRSVLRMDDNQLYRFDIKRFKLYHKEEL